MLHKSIGFSSGTNTEFLFDYTVKKGIKVYLESPSGRRFDGNSPEVTHNRVFGIYKFKIPGEAEV